MVRQKARSRSFEPGQEILALLPSPGNQLQAKYCGPYTILEKLGFVNYLIDTPNRRKQKSFCRVNMLMLYRRRDEKQFPNSVNPITVSVATVVPENDVGVTIPALSDLKTSTPTHTKNVYLTQLQQTKLDKLLAMYVDIFSDTPGKTFLATDHPPNLNGPKRLNKRSSISNRD